MTNVHVYAPIEGSKRDLAQEALGATRNAVQGTQSVRKEDSKGLAFVLGMFVAGFKAKTSRKACKRLVWHLVGVGAVIMFIVSPYTLGTILAVSVCLTPIVLTWRLATWNTRRKVRKNA